MQERRTEARMLCADLIEVRWTDESGLAESTMANLEDISAAGACLQMEKPVPQGVTVQLCHPNLLLEGKVRYCVYRDLGYFAGVQFDEGTQWSLGQYRPQHMLDPRRLMRRKKGRRK